jgi:lysophospholipase L1-like esterase
VKMDIKIVVALLMLSPVVALATVVVDFDSASHRFALFGESTATQSGLNFGTKIFQSTAAIEGGTGNVVIAPNDSDLLFQGSQYITSDVAGAYFQRHSDAVLALSHAQKGFSTKRAKTTTGISMWFKTDSNSVTIKFSHDLSTTVANRNSRFGVYENGEFVSSHFFPKTAAELNFSVSSVTSGAASVFRIVLPNWSKADFRGLELDSGASLLPYAPPARKSYVAMGDSISHGTGQGSTYQTYPWILAELLDVELSNIAVGGAQVSIPTAEMLSEFPPVNVISLLIGYNDLHFGGKTAVQYEADLNTMLDTVRVNQPNAQLFCISPIFTTNPTNSATGVNIQEYRQAVYDAVTNRQVAGDTLIHLIRGEDISSASDLSDVVHLSESGAANFATNLFTQMDSIVNSARFHPQHQLHGAQPSIGRR